MTLMSAHVSRLARTSSRTRESPWTITLREFPFIMNYGEIGGKTEPPITSLTVFTVGPLAARGCSQLSRAVKSAAVMEYKWRVVFFVDFLFEIASS